MSHAWYHPEIATDIWNAGAHVAGRGAGFAEETARGVTGFFGGLGGAVTRTANAPAEVVETTARTLEDSAATLTAAARDLTLGAQAALMGTGAGLVAAGQAATEAGKGFKFAGVGLGLAVVAVLVVAAIFIFRNPRVLTGGR